MTLGIGTLPTRTRQPVRVISAVYPVQTREQRRLLARNASHAGRLVAIGVALPHHRRCRVYRRRRLQRRPGFDLGWSARSIVGSPQTRSRGPERAFVRNVREP